MKHTGLVKKATLAALAGVATLALSGCGGSGTDTGTTTSTSASTTSSTSTSTTASSTTTPDAGGTVSLADAEVGDKIDAAELGLAMLGAFKDGTSGHIDMDMMGITGKGDFVISDGKQNQHVTMDLMGQKMEMISVDGVTYMKSPLFAGGTKWIKTEDLPGGTATPSTDVLNPEIMAKAFGGRQAEVTAKDGSGTTFTLELSLKKLLDAAGAGASGLPTGSMPDNIPVTYVVDGEGRPVETRMTMGSMPMKVTYSDWGKKVDIEAPPSSAVTTMAS